MLQNLGESTVVDARTIDHDSEVASFIGRLRTEEYDVGNFFDDIGAAKAALLRSLPLSHEQRRDIEQVDRLLRDCLTQTSLIHERAIEGMSYAFCEIAHDGLIAYANLAMKRLVPECEGKRFAGLFGRHGPPIARAVVRQRKRVTRELVLRPARGAAAADGERIVRAEIAPVPGSRSSFAILHDVSSQRAIERDIYARAPFPVLLLRPDLTVEYANRPTEQLLGIGVDAIVGTDAAGFVCPEDRQEILRQSRQRLKGEIGAYEANIVDPDSGVTKAVKIVSTPRFNSLDEYVGSVTTLQSLEEERAYRELMALMLSDSPAKAVWDQMLEIVRRIVPFDVATLTFYTDEGAFARPEFSWPQDLAYQWYRWFPIPPSFREAIERPFWEPNLGAYVRRQPDGDQMLDQPAMQALLESGIGPFINIPLRSNKGIRSAFSLLSRDAKAYDGATVERLQELGLDAVLGALLQRVEAERSSFKVDLIDSMAAAKNMGELASAILERLRTTYGWDHASIFKINAVRGQFELLSQSCARDDMSLRDDYVQPLDKGLFGLAYRRAKDGLAAPKKPDRKDYARARIASYSTLRPDTEGAQVHVAGCSKTKSEMCCAVLLKGRPVWILNFEDARENAFMPVDFDLLIDMVSYLERNVKRAFNEHTLSQIVDVMQEGVVTCDIEGRIIRLNQKAMAMFSAAGLGGVERGELLATCLDELAAQSILEPPSRTPIEAVLGNGRRRVLMTTATLDDSYDHRIILLSDIQQDNWAHGARVIREAVEEVIDATRKPRSLVTTLLSEIRSTASTQSGNDLRDIVEMASRAIGQLDKLAVGYDNVLRSNAIAKLGSRPDIATVLMEIVSRTPPENRATIVFEMPEILPCTRLAPSKLGSILSAMLGRIMASSARTDMLMIRVKASARWAAISMLTGTGAPLAGQAAPEDEQIQAIRKMARSYDGSFRYRLLDDGGEEIAIALHVEEPAANPVEVA
jgi:PAS domain-containing protein